MNHLHSGVMNDSSVCSTPIHHNRPYLNKARSTAIVCAIIFLANATGVSAAKLVTKDLYKGTAAANKHYCAIVLLEDGYLRPSPNNSTISSKTYGGRPGVANVEATRSSYRLTIDPPLGFIGSPDNGNDGAVFNASFSGNGASTFSETPGNIPVKIKKGTTRVEANFEAIRSNGVFPAGNYRAEVILRCE